MAGAALRAHGAVMNIVGLVTAGAVGRQLAARDRRRMTGLAVDFRVLALQRPVTLLLVVVPSVFPLHFAMALLAIIAKPPAMTIVRCMAAGALIRDLGLGIPGAMAGIAGHLRMRAIQGEVGDLLVIIERGFPLIGVVARAALRAASTFVGVVARMTGNALHRRVLIRGISMAIRASRARMRVFQGEMRFRVIEIGLLETDLVVALGAVLAQFALVNVLLFMAGKARGRGFAEFFTGHVAAGAAHGLVPAF